MNHFLKWISDDGTYWFQGPGRWCDCMSDATPLTLGEAASFRTDCMTRKLFGKFHIIHSRNGVHNA